MPLPAGNHLCAQLLIALIQTKKPIDAWADEAGLRSPAGRRYLPFFAPHNWGKNRGVVT
jgi:hypothetical protein